MPLFLLAGVARADQVLTVRAAVAPLAVEAGGKAQLRVALEINPPYHINANPPSFGYLIPTTIKVDPLNGIRVKTPLYPVGHPVAAGGFEAPIEVYDGRVTIAVPLEIAVDHPRGLVRLRGTVSFQACDDHACFAPTSLPFEASVEVAPPGMTSAVETIPARPAPILIQSDSAAFVLADSPPSVSLGDDTFEIAWSTHEAPANGTESIGDAGKPDEGFLAWILAAFLGGLALNLTPCVYPLIPITISYFARQSGGSRRRTVTLALLYVVALATVFAILGSAAALTGSMFGSILQNRWILIGMAVVMIAFAAGMMGAFEIRLPTALNRFTAAKPGPGGALMMGATVGIVAAPCIGPFVVSLLSHVGGRGNPTEGFLLFLSLGLGLGAPFVPLAILSGRLFSWPSAGPILVTVKRLLGLVLLGLAAWFLLPLLGGPLFRLTLGGVLLAGGFAFFFWAVAGESRGARLARRGIALLLILGGGAILTPKASETPIEWRPYSIIELANAAGAGRLAVVDVYADWCPPCHELDAFTFTDGAVREALAGMLLMKADVTGPRIDPDVDELTAQKGINGVPTILFFDAAGREREDLRLVGFEGPAGFLERLRALREERPAGRE